MLCTEHSEWKRENNNTNTPSRFRLVPGPYLLLLGTKSSSKTTHLVYYPSRGRIPRHGFPLPVFFSSSFFDFYFYSGATLLHLFFLFLFFYLIPISSQSLGFPLLLLSTSSPSIVCDDSLNVSSLSLSPLASSFLYYTRCYTRLLSLAIITLATLDVDWKRRHPKEENGKGITKKTLKRRSTIIKTNTKTRRNRGIKEAI